MLPQTPHAIVLLHERSQILRLSAMMIRPLPQTKQVLLAEIVNHLVDEDL